MPRPWGYPPPVLTAACLLAALLGPGLGQADEAPAPPAPPEAPAAPAAVPRLMGLDDFVRLIDECHPQLAQAAFAIEAARGKADQAGRYPNPTIEITGDEISDRTGPGGTWTAPFFKQEIVTRGKLRLDRAAALREVDRATQNYFVQRFVLISAVRQHYFDVLALQQRLTVLSELVQVAEKSVAGTQRLLEQKLASRLDVVQLEGELEKLRAEQEAARAELPAAFRRLAALAGSPDLPVAPLFGTLAAPTPEFDLDLLTRQVRESHPEAQAARVAIDRAQILLRRAEVERIPNVTIGAGYQRQNQNRSNDWTIGVSLPVPLWNRNQGHIRSARAELGGATSEASRVEIELVERVAAAYREYSGARQKAERYRTAILPRAREAFDLSAQAFRGGQFDYLKVLQAQRSYNEATLEYLKWSGDAWKAASVLAGLSLEEQWPVAPAAPAPAAAPGK